MTSAPAGRPFDKTWSEQVADGHRIEWNPGWEYKTTSAFERDHPNGWDYKATCPEGFQLNGYRGLSYDDEVAGVELVRPGVRRIPRAASGPLLVAHWRREKS